MLHEEHILPHVLAPRHDDYHPCARRSNDNNDGDGIADGYDDVDYAGIQGGSVDENDAMIMSTASTIVT